MLRGEVIYRGDGQEGMVWRPGKGSLAASPLPSCVTSANAQVPSERQPRVLQTGLVNPVRPVSGVSVGLREDEVSEHT